MGEQGQISWKTSLQRYGPWIPFTMLVFRFAIRITVVEIKLGPTLLGFYFDCSTRKPVQDIWQFITDLQLKQISFRYHTIMKCNCDSSSKKVDQNFQAYRCQFVACEKIMIIRCVSYAVSICAYDFLIWMFILGFFLQGSYGVEQFYCTEIGSSHPFYSGSPPSRVANPLIQDARFGDEKLTPLSPAPPPSGLSSSPSSSARKGGYVRANFGNKPAVRVEGFDCLDRDRRNCRIPTLAQSQLNSTNNEEGT